MADQLLSHPSLKRDYYVPDDLTPEEFEDTLKGLQKQEGQEQINAKQARETKRQFNTTLDQAAGMSQPVSAFAEGALQSGTFNVSDAGAALAGVDLNDPRAARNTNPNYFAAGQTAGVLIPGSGTAKGVKTVGGLMLRGAGLGGLMGGTSGGAGAIVEGERNPLEIAKSAIVPGLIGAGLGAGISGLAGKLSPVISRYLERKKTVPGVNQGALQNAQVSGRNVTNVTINQNASQQAGKNLSTAQAQKVIDDQFKDFGAFGEIQSAIKPIGSKKYNFQKNLSQNISDILPHFTPGEGVEGFEKAVEQTMVRQWTSVTRALEDAGEKGLVVDGNKIAENMARAASNAKLLRETGGKSDLIDKILSRSNSYRGEIPVDEAEAILRQTNAELDAYYSTLSKSRFQAQKMAKANPEKYADILLAEGLRSELDKTLSGLTGGKFQQFKTKYGQLQELLQSIQDAKPRIMSHQEMSLQQKLGLAQSLKSKVENQGVIRGGGMFALEQMIGKADSPDAKVNRAFEKIIKKSKTTRTNFQKSP